MPILTSYLVISSATFELQAEQQRTFIFELPGALVVRVNTAQPLLAYQVKPLTSQNDSSATLAIDVNDHHLVNLQLEQAMLRGVWESFPGYFLRANSTNLLQFRLLSGAVQLVNVVLWFQREE